ncbi:helix-turn-helix transcriptional regulator [Streptomyces sp. NPDC018029]|uniref:helix-turn-helix transcriptional regulator n=1 Tax=Streptomyces sp. NPDC018029 TaxID=3365032 RepID=UPI00379401CF
MENKVAQRQLLRWKRAQIDPVELGWPLRTGRGRRTSGLSQAQVAQALFVSERTYADLERGEIASPTAELLDSVAKVLRMNESERAAMYVYSLGHQPPTPMDPMAGTTVYPAWHQAVRTVTGQPCFIVDVAWNVLAANDEFIHMFPQTPGGPVALPERNLMRWMLLREEAREHHLVNWEKEWAPAAASQLRTAVAAHPDNEDLQRLDREIYEDPVVGPIYRNPSMDYVHPDGDACPVRHAGFTNTVRVSSEQDRCCDKHAPSQFGMVTMCVAQPLASPGARFIFLVFTPASPPSGHKAAR